MNIIANIIITIIDICLFIYFILFTVEDVPNRKSDLTQFSGHIYLTIAKQTHTINSKGFDDIKMHLHRNNNMHYNSNSSCDVFIKKYRDVMLVHLTFSHMFLLKLLKKN